MAEINLLPWRELKREHKKKEFNLFLVIGMITAVLMVFLINFYANHLVEHQSLRNQLLENEIKRLEKKIKEIDGIKQLRQALIARMTIIQNLQATRALSPRLFDELIKIIPNGVYLTKFERKGDTITMLGYAESNSNISELMRNIERNQWIQNPDLTEIKKIKEAESQVNNEFKLSFILREAKK